MLRVLIVGGDGARAVALREGLRKQGYGIVCARSAALGARLAPDVDVAIFALDRVGTTSADIGEVLDQIDRRVPIMVVPERIVSDDRVVARRAPLERCAFGDVEADFLSYRATKAGDEIDLSPREFELLRYLAERSDRVVTREELLRGVWGNSGSNLTRTVDVHIAKLRRKIGDSSHESRHILTVHRAGYRFVA
jgi:DNA-binding response OmpR family regulator